MRITLGALRQLIIEGLSKPYEDDLADDPSMNKKSVYVPDDIKKPIKSYLKAMGLSRRKKKRPRS